MRIIKSQFVAKIFAQLLSQKFYFNNPDVILKLCNIYCCSFMDPVFET